MIYIVCDMNVNNFGNYFKVIGHERQVTQDESGYIVKEENGCFAYYPKGHCYRAKRVERLDKDIINYSEAIDYLIPEDYVRWQKTRFKEIYKVTGKQKEKIAKIIYQELNTGLAADELMCWDNAYAITDRLIKEGGIVIESE